MAAEDPEAAAEAAAQARRDRIAEEAIASIEQASRSAGKKDGYLLLGGATATALLAALTAFLINSPAKHTPTPHPTVTVIVTPSPKATAVPQPTVTVLRYVTLQSGGSDGWVAIAALGTAVAGIGTLLGGAAAFMAVRRRRTDDNRDPDAGPKAGAGT